MWNHVPSSFGGVGGGGEVVDDSGVRRARRGDDGEHPLPVVVVEPVDSGVERGRREPAALVGRRQHDVGVHRLGRLGDRGVGAGAAEDQPAGSVERPAGARPATSNGRRATPTGCRPYHR